MARNIVICCDGTSNSAADEEFGVPAPTNVHRLYQACLDRAESKGMQFVWYQPGVGALGNKTSRAFEGATGTGISANIRRGYLALAQNYKAGDNIFLFGFSRGAFTARSIAGMVRQVGLLTEPTTEGVAQAYDYYRYKSYANEKPKPDYPAPGELPVEVQHANLPLKTRFVRIHFIGVWDTVGALGVPLWGESFNLEMFFRNTFHELSPNIITDHVYHALAMDEMRPSFMPMLWKVKTSEKEEPAGHIEQVWFRGVHSDVGGGYADRQLADIAHHWLLEQAVAHGLLLRAGTLANIAAAAKPTGRIHRSYAGALYTAVGGWPRWYPPLARAMSPAPLPLAQPYGYLHQSIFEREKECARNGSKELPICTLLPGESYTVEVPAEQLWTNTGLVLEQGASYIFEPTGLWQDLNDEPVNAAGQVPTSETVLKRLTRVLKRVPGQPWMQLVGLVNYPRNWQWRERQLRSIWRVLLRGNDKLNEALFPIGPATTHTVAKPDDGDSGTGLLWVFANDTWMTHANNTGSLSLKITRL